jgi:hypothetical protein
LSHVGRSLLFSRWRAVSLGEAEAVVLVVDYRYPFCLCVGMYIWGVCGWAQTIGSIGEAGGGFPFGVGCRRRVAVGGVADGETGSINL